jgi:hypothetical protein
MSVGSTGIVTSVRGIPGGPVSVYARGTTTPADSGPLDIGFAFNTAPGQQQVSGYTVVKSMEGNSINSGPVVERIRCLDGSIGLTQKVGQPEGQGEVFITAQNTGISGEMEYLSYGNAKFERQGLFQYTKLLGWDTSAGPNNIDTAFFTRFTVPYGIDESADFLVKLYFTVFGTQDIPVGADPRYAGLVFNYAVLPDNLAITADDAWNSMVDSASASNPLGLLESDPISVYLPLGKTGADPVYRAWDPMLLHNDDDLSDIPRRRSSALGYPIPNTDTLSYWNAAWGVPRVKSGSVVVVKIARGPVSGVLEYSSPLGFLNMKYKLAVI